MIPRACCRHHLVDRYRVGHIWAQASAQLRAVCVAVPATTTQRSRNQHRELGTTATSVPAGRERANGAENGEGAGIAGLTVPAPYVLPAPTWSLSDLNVATYDKEAADSARAVLSPEEVAKLCALAHIELAPEGGGSPGSSSSSGSGSSGNLNVATVQKDVGAMLRCMQTMRREGRDGEGEHAEEKEGEEDGPWGGAAPWAAPLQEDVVSDGGIQDKVLGAAQRSEDGFFTAPRVIEK